MKIKLIIGFIIFSAVNTHSHAQMGHGMMRHMGESRMMGNPQQESVPDRYRSNGKQIYVTGVSSKTGTLRFKGGPPWLKMHGGGCISCHGANGTGGVAVMMGTVIPPDIRYTKLSQEDHRHAEEEDAHEGYTDDLIKQAITKGIKPNGKKLDSVMPRYSLSEDDLNDLIEYLKTLR